jgi:hypothetical protein
MFFDSVPKSLQTPNGWQVLESLTSDVLTGPRIHESNQFPVQ